MLEDQSRWNSTWIVSFMPQTLPCLTLFFIPFLSSSSSLHSHLKMELHYSSIFLLTQFRKKKAATNVSDNYIYSLKLVMQYHFQFFLHTNYVNELTSREKVLLGKLKVAGLNKESSPFLGTLRLINNRSYKYPALDSVRNSTNSVHAVIIMITFNITHPFTSRTSNWSTSVRVCVETGCIYINNCPTRCNTKQSIYYSAVHSTYFGCQPHPSSGVHKTVTTASCTSLYFMQLPPSKVANLATLEGSSTGGCSYSVVYSWRWVWLTPETCRVNLSQYLTNLMHTICM